MCTVLLRINAGGVHLIFDIFLGAFIQGRRLHEGGVYYKTSIFFYPKNGSFLTFFPFKKKGGGGGGGGVYSREAFSRGRVFIRSNTVIVASYKHFRMSIKM